MKTEKRISNQNKEYAMPQVRTIELDQMVSIQLQSQPPIGPGEYGSNLHDNFNNDPFNNNI